MFRNVPRGFVLPIRSSDRTKPDFFGHSRTSRDDRAALRVPNPSTWVRFADSTFRSDKTRLLRTFPDTARRSCGVPCSETFRVGSFCRFDLRVGQIRTSSDIPGHRAAIVRHCVFPNVSRGFVLPNRPSDRTSPDFCGHSRTPRDTVAARLNCDAQLRSSPQTGSSRKIPEIPLLHAGRWPIANPPEIFKERRRSPRGTPRHSLRLKQYGPAQQRLAEFRRERAVSAEEDDGYMAVRPTPSPGRMAVSTTTLHPSPPEMGSPTRWQVCRCECIYNSCTNNLAVSPFHSSSPMPLRVSQSHRLGRGRW
jgi:hypothetical protein